MAEVNGTTIGQSVVINGELRASENLTIEGQADGQINLDENALTIGANGRVTAEVMAKVVEVRGKVTGDIMATEKITLHEGSAVRGDLTAPRVAIAEGASFQGKIDMQRSQAPKAATTKGA